MTILNSYNMLALVIGIIIMTAGLISAYIAQKCLFVKYRGKTNHVRNKKDTR
ncbi:hypothetical protein SAMN05446037_1001174 [Anaerovirgula multivorans]|uniref:Uncharacterized protein n=1 Tax=Anaerovirgula multivorans TaxID=312168 RepID=A0A238ZWX0_9FIRM|nr:hypothetical protein [Anaerovirgula multivorans]SNR87632.1 hypothetical protein SAMN05446037_1001174 [Anaerovirgula multivorans]